MKDKARSRPTRRIRPEWPKLDYMICPNLLAYALSWYGLFVGKFPLQVLFTSIGFCLFFTAGMYRMEITELVPEDYLPTDSRSNIEKEIAQSYNQKNRADEWTTPVVRLRTIESDDEYLSENSTRRLGRGLKLPSSRRFRRRRAKFVPWQLKLPSFLTSETDEDWKQDSVIPWSPSRSIERRQVDRKRRSFRGQNCRTNSVLIIAKVNSSDTEGRRFNLLNQTFLNEVKRLEGAIYRIKVEIQNRVFQFLPVPNRTSICTRGRGNKCSGFNLKTMASFVLTATHDPLGVLLSPDSVLALTYPNYFLLDLSPFLGGVQTLNNRHNGFVERVEAFREVFCVNQHWSDPLMKRLEVWKLWEEQFDLALRRFSSPLFDIYWVTEFQKHDEQNVLISEMVPKIGVTFLALMLWCAVGAVNKSAVRSKPWVGFVGVFATMTATMAGFGFCLWLDSKFSPVLMAVPLLTLAIGLDDMFIILESWSRTSPCQPVEERMMQAMSQGGTSIFITFVINLLDFIVGNYTPYPIINYLSSTATVTILFDFICQMTIFCSSVTLFSLAEPAHRHSCVCCIKVGKPKSYVTALINANTKARMLQLMCCTEGQKYSKLEQPKRRQPIADMASNTMLSNSGRAIVVCGFIVYISMSLWSLSYLNIGLKPERVFRQNSNIYKYMKQQHTWFNDFNPEVVATVDKELDYSTPEVQQMVSEFVETVEASGLFWGAEETTFWLRDFLKWYDDIVRIGNMTCCPSVAYMLEEIQYYPDGFLMTEPFAKHGKDIQIDMNSTRILKCRIRFRAKKATNPQRQIAMMKMIRKISDSYQDKLNVSVYSSDFLLFDQFLTAIPATLYYGGITLIVTVIVALFMVPNIFCVFWVGLSVVSILVGIVGIMRIWDMDLDSVSLINLLIAITLSADFVTHAAYKFLMASPKDASDNLSSSNPTSSKIRLFKARALLSEVAHPAILASIGTILSVLAMSTSSSYIFLTFFKIMFLTIVLSLLHALAFLPVFLSIFGPSGSAASVKKNPSSSSDPTSIPPVNNGILDSILEQQYFNDLGVQNTQPLACSTRNRKKNLGISLEEADILQSCVSAVSNSQPDQDNNVVVHVEKTHEK